MVRRGLLLLTLFALPLPAQAAPVQWPSWPSEVDRAAAPLVDPTMGSRDRERTAALIRLQRFPTALIEEPLRIALAEDPSLQVVREALRICYLRRAAVCLEPATAIYEDGGMATLRAPALRVIATDPRGERLDMLLEAMLDPSDTLRAEAAQLAGWAPLRGDALARTRRALLSKLSDSASAVRERAVTSLGLQGPGEGTLAIARLLEDPEPDVRASAAVALGRIGDRKATAALLRALEGPNEGNVTRVMLGALARLPGEDVADALLGFLDDPPPGVGALTVAEAIGDRAEPEPPLIDGLVDRLRDPGVEAAARRSLLWLGEAAAPRLEQALARGLGPRLDAEVQRLLSATAPLHASGTHTESWPAAEDVRGWSDRLRIGSATRRMSAAAALGTRHPAWLVDRVHARIARGPLDAARSWVFALAMHPERVAFRGDALIPWTRLAQWSLDRTQAQTDRCTAALALGRAKGRAAERVATETFDTLLGDPDPRIRACAALSARDVAPERTALALLDSDPRSRAAAASVTRGEDLAAHRRQLATTDPSPHVRAASARPASTQLELVVGEPSTTPWADPALWLDDDTVVLGRRPAPWGLRAVAATPR